MAVDYYLHRPYRHSNILIAVESILYSFGGFALQ